jgi:hypothetical protein
MKFSEYLLQFCSESQIFPSIIKNLKTGIRRNAILLLHCIGLKLVLTLRGQDRLRVFENRALRRIFGSKGEGTGGWTRLHNEDLHKYY